MTRYVLDASAVAAWALPSQHTPSAAKLLEEAKSHSFVVPHIFPVEVRNLFLAAERRDKFRIAETDDALHALEHQLDLTVYGTEHPAIMHEAMGIARMERLSMYDALYLIIAIDEYAVLATRDGVLVAAGERRGVTVLDLRL